MRCCMHGLIGEREADLLVLQLHFGSMDGGIDSFLYIS